MEALRERFGKYYVLEKIAQGGMAEVYKVKTVGIAGFEKVQALKRILPHSAREGRFIRSFIDEARIAVELTHRNIVQVFDFGKADGELFLAMELIEGKDLRTAIAQAVDCDLLPTVGIAAYIVSEVAAGLDYAHRKTDVYGGALHIVHCDVSPSNVMLSSDGYVKILDFGIARASFASALERRRLRGKPRYMAPEQTLGEPPTAASDVFALGIIAWELFTGLPLFRGPDVRSILEAVRTTEPPRIDRVNANIPRAIADAVATALAREPAARGAVADLAAACARTAMTSGSRTLARWLGEIEQPVLRPTLTALGVPSEIDAPLPRPIEPLHRAAPPPRPSARSITQALGSGTPGFSPYELAPDPQPNDPHTQVTPLPRGEATHDTSYDELAAGEATRGFPLDEPIDDDLPHLLGAMADGVLAERRRIVIAAALLSGAPSDVLRTVTRSLGELAYQRGGVAIELADAALVIAFGLEIAGEDDVAIAMGWALDANAMARDAGAAVRLRIGACTGVHVQAGADRQPRLPADAIEAAKALARDAAPERPLFTGGAGRLTSSLYELRDALGVPDRSLRAPGRTGLVPRFASLVARRSRVIEVVGPRGFDERDRARLERRGTFVGRAAPLAELTGALQRAIAEERRLAALISGAAGTGKSRLVAELIARWSAPGAGPPVRVLTCAASPASHLTPFALVIDLYQAALGLPPARGRSARGQVVQHVQHSLLKAGTAAERAKDIATDLDRAMELRDGVGFGARELADLRPRISAGLAKFRAALADPARPLITVIEDIHLADSASLEVLRHALAVPVGAPELLVLTARPDGVPGPPVDITVELGDLVGSELRALIADRLGDAATPRNIAAVLARGGGNPLFVEELAAAVRDAATRGEEVPASASDVVLARIERLTAKARAALRFAAVLGGAVRARLLEELLGEHSLEPELDELVRGGFLIRPASDARGDGAGGAAGELDAPSSEDALQFARGLIREVVYESLPAHALRESHARVGRLLASRFFAGREEPPAAIAEHLERGGELAGAAAFWLRAGRLALTASDAAAAVACFARTLLLERDLGAEPPTAPSRARRREAFAGREEAHRLLGDLASDPGDLDELQRLCAGDPGRLADVAIRRAQRTMGLGDYAAATAAARTAEEHAAAAGDDRLRGEALRVRGEILERLGRFDEALAAVGAARELFRRAGLVAEEMAALLGRGRIHLLCANYEAARDAYRPVIALIDQTGDPWLERIAASHVAVIDMCLGNFQRAMVSAERSLELCRRYGDRAREGDALSVAGIISLEVGRLDDAAGKLDEALAVLGSTASRWSRTDCLIYAGICASRRGTSDGLAPIDEALAEARRLNARYLEANALVARAGVQLRRGALADALADAARGTAVARDAKLVGYEIQGLAHHALALSRSQRGAEAAELARRALGLLDQQRYLESSEEEVLVACAEALRGAGDAEGAHKTLAWGRAFAQQKLAALTDPAWRAAFLATPWIRALLDGAAAG